MKDILEGHYTRLKLFDANKHAKSLFQELCEKSENKDIWALQPYGPFTKFDDFIAHFEDDFSQDNTCGYMIFKKSDNQPYGLCSYCDIVPEHKRLEIGDVTYSTALQKTVEATEAIHLLLKKAFEDLRFRRCSWKCNSKNEASRNAAFRLGFKYEGRFRNHRWEKNQNRDTDWFSIIEEEWPAVKNAQEKWLHPDNFDEKGRQKKRLKEFFLDRI